MKTFDKRTLAIITLFCSLVPSAIGGTDQCLICHRALSDKPSSLFRTDVHHKRGITCAGCHGGNADTDDMAAAMDSAAGFLGVPKGDAISRACAACHSDEARMKSYGSALALRQWESLQSSVHGKISNAEGNHIVQCITCHDAHGIVPTKHPSSPVSPLNVVARCAGCHSDPAFMRVYDPSLPVDQLEKYRTSTHGTRNAQGDPKAAECVSCHGSHSILGPDDVKSQVYPENLPRTCARCHSDSAYMKGYKIPTDQFEKFAASVHGVALLQRHDAGAPACNNCHGNHGAAPPGVASISNVCGTCHAINAELFAASPHKRAFDERGLPECETCHGNHATVATSSQLLGTDSAAVCSRCHSASENPRGFQAAGAMRLLADSLEGIESESAALVDEAERKGMEVSASKFDLRDIRQVRMESRTVAHAFDEARFREVALKGIAQALKVREEGRDALEEFRFRRIGLGASTLAITVLALSLYLTIRRIERRQQAKRQPVTHESSTIR